MTDNNNIKIGAQGEQQFFIKISEALRGQEDLSGKMTIIDVRDPHAMEVSGVIHRIEILTEGKGWQKLRLHCSTGHLINAWVDTLPTPLEIISREDVRAVFSEHLRRPIFEGDFQKIVDYLKDHSNQLDEALQEAVKTIWKIKED